MNAEKRIKQWWEDNSKTYQEKYGLPIYIHYGPGIPNEDKLKLMGNVKGKEVLVLGCGGGQCSVAFAKKGSYVTAIDISEEQLKYARRLADIEGIKINYIQGSFQNLNMVKTKSMDIVFSAWAFQFSKNINRLFGQIYRVLKTGGLFVFSQPHPFLTCIDAQTLRIKKSYFKIGELVEGNYVWFERTIADLYNA